MKTEAPPTLEATPPPSVPPTSLRTWIVPTLILSGVAGTLLAFFLSIFPIKGFTTPIGWDAAEYLWRTRVAQQAGLEQTTQPLPSLARPKSGRPGYLVIGSTLSALGRVSPIRLQMVMTSVLAAVIALAAGAFVTGILRRSRWELAVVALFVGLSPPVLRLMMPEGYLDTMLAAAVFTVGATAVVLALEDRRALLPAMLFLGAGGIVHWTFFTLTAAMLVVFAALLVPRSWRAWRGGAVGFWDTPSIRVGEALAGGGVIGAGMLFGVLGERLPTPRTDVSEFAKKLKRDLPKYHFAVTIPVAAAGVASLAVPALQDGRTAPSDDPVRLDRARRSWYTLALLLAWCGVVLAGYVGRRYLHLSVPAHRFLSFGLAIPILVALGVLWVAGLARRVTALLGLAVVVGSLAVAAYAAHAQWSGAKPFVQRPRLQDAGLAGAYLAAQSVPLNRPFVLVVGDVDYNNIALISHTARAGLPPDRLSSLYLYVGTPESYLARQPIDTDVSRSYFQRIRPLYDRDPVVLLLASYNPRTFGAWVAAHPETRVSPTVAVLAGPVNGVASLRSEAPPAGPIAWWQIGFIAVGALLALTLAGLGWALLFFRRWLRPIELLAVSPAAGIAAIVVVGSLADRLGLHLVGTVGAAVPVLAALLGWGAWALDQRRVRRDLPTGTPAPA